MHSSNRHVLVVICFIFVLGDLCSPREIPMSSKQNVQSQEQATRIAIDSFNEVFNRHDADGLAAFLTKDTVFRGHITCSGWPTHRRKDRRGRILARMVRPQSRRTV